MISWRLTALLKTVASWVPRLLETYEQLGFKNVNASHYPTKSELRAFFTQLQFMVNEEFSYASCDNSSPEAIGPRLRNLIAEASQESCEGVNLNFVIEATIGRRPLWRLILLCKRCPGSFHQDGDAEGDFVAGNWLFQANKAPNQLPW